MLIGIDLIYGLLTYRGVNKMKVWLFSIQNSNKNNYKRHLSTVMHKRASRFISEYEELRKKTSNKRTFKLPFRCTCHQTTKNVDGTRYMKKSERMNDGDEPCIGYLNQEEDKQTNTIHSKTSCIFYLYIFYIYILKQITNTSCGKFTIIITRMIDEKITRYTFVSIFDYSLSSPIRSRGELMLYLSVF